MRFLIIFISFIFLNANNFENFKSKFIINDSYVIDPYNNRVTSESQGYGLLIALKYNDKKLFDNLWKWTKNHLQRKDYLFAWIWRDKILDKNNASDGDILISYALYIAYRKWNDLYYIKEFLKIENAIKNLIIPIKDNYILLPGKIGFIHNNLITIYPSYYIPFALKKFYYYDLDNLWIKTYNYAYNNIFTINNITTTLKFDLFTKKLLKNDHTDLDVYRLIPYVYLDNKNRLKILRNTFKKVDLFFMKNGYIPLKFGKTVKGYSPYCIYDWFYLLYKNSLYLEKANSLRKLDKNNYYCEAINLLINKEGF